MYNDTTGRSFSAWDGIHPRVYPMVSHGMLAEQSGAVRAIS